LTLRRTNESSKASTYKSALEVTCRDLQTQLDECQRRLQQAEVALQHVSSFRETVRRAFESGSSRETMQLQVTCINTFRGRCQGTTEPHVPVGLSTKIREAKTKRVNNNQ
jgi:signal recognition particle GTPase